MYVDPASGVDRSFGAPTGLSPKALRDTAKHLDVKTLRSMGVADAMIWKQAQVVHGPRRPFRARCTRSSSSCARSRSRSRAAWATLARARGSREHGARCTRCTTARTARAEGDGGGARARARVLLIATGSRPAPVPGIEFDHCRVFDSDSIVKLGFLPRSLAIVGAGIVAIEFARIFQLLGARVTLLVRGDVLSGLAKVGLDPDVAAMLKAVLVDAGIDIREGTTISSLEVPPPARASTMAARAPIRIALSTKGAVEPPAPLEVDVLMAAAAARRDREVRPRGRGRRARQARPRRPR